MRLEDIEFKHQRTVTLMLDAVYLLNLSTELPAQQASTAARAAITNAALVLESTSNSCLLALDLPRKLQDELDRLPTLSKLDYFLFATTGKHIDRGCKEAELAGEVLRLRDHVVHPKPRSGILKTQGESQVVDYGVTAALSIPFDTREWDFNTAQLVANVVLNFAKKFFLEWCGKDVGQVTNLLGTFEKSLITAGVRCWLVCPKSDVELINRILPSLFDIIDIRPHGADA